MGAIFLLVTGALMAIAIALVVDGERPSSLRGVVGILGSITGGSLLLRGSATPF
jgi:hypothetical protein